MSPLLLLLLTSVPGVDVPRMVPPDKEFPLGLACYDYCVKRTSERWYWWGRDEYCCPPKDSGSCVQPYTNRPWVKEWHRGTCEAPEVS